MHSSQFDGNAAFSGGGFMPATATQSTDSSFSSSKNRDTQGIVPLTVKQINEALLTTNDSTNFGVDGVDVTNVTIVGMVFNMVERVTDICFVLDDGTGRINVIRWVNESYDTKEMSYITEKMYVRVHANLRGFQGKRQVVAFAVRVSSVTKEWTFALKALSRNILCLPMTDFNELTFHFLECMYVHMYNTKLRAASVSVDPQTVSSVNGTPFRGHQGTQQNQFSELRGVDQLVIEYLQQPANLESERGVHVNELMHQLNIPLDKITASLKVLDEEGMVYSTVDDEHFKSTGNA